MSQLALIFDAPPAPAYTMAHARAAGQRAGQKAADKAEGQAPGFREAAQAFVLGFLKQHGPSSGEDITAAMVLAGIRPRDKRAFGPVYQALAGKRMGLIVCLRSDLPRRLGHGTSGGKLWGLT